MIGVGVDGSEESKETLRFVLGKARWRTNLHVVHAFREWESIRGTSRFQTIACIRCKGLAWGRVTLFRSTRVSPAIERLRRSHAFSAARASPVTACLRQSHAFRETRDSSEARRSVANASPVSPTPPRAVWSCGRPGRANAAHPHPQESGGGRRQGERGRDASPAPRPLGLIPVHRRHRHLTKCAAARIPRATLVGRPPNPTARKNTFMLRVAEEFG